MRYQTWCDQNLKVEIGRKIPIKAEMIKNEQNWPIFVILEKSSNGWRKKHISWRIRIYAYHKAILSQYHYNIALHMVMMRIYDIKNQKLDS